MGQGGFSQIICALCMAAGKLLGTGATTSTEKGRAGTYNTLGMLKHLMGAKAPKSHLCLQPAKASGVDESPSSALALHGHS